MRRSIGLIVAAFMVFSCGLQEIGEREKFDGVWVGPGFNISEESAGPLQNTVWYATGFDYPSGYDWKADPESGAVKCSLVVFANTVPMLKVPIGRDYLASADPDMHRVIDGSLYTDYSTDSLTFIGKNGKQLFCYPGREMIMGMIVDGEDVYTLGQSRTGNGFSYRKNGEIIVCRERGQLFNHFLKSADGECSFAFTEPILSASGQIDKYYICVDGKVSQVAVRDDVIKVWDAIYQEGHLYLLADLVGVDAPVFMTDDGMEMLQLPSLSKMSTCRLVSRQPEPCIEGIILNQDGLAMSCIWEGRKIHRMFSIGMTVSSIFTHEDGIYAAITSSRDGSTKIYRSGELFDVPQGYTVMGAGAMSLVDGMLHVGLSSISGERPLVWIDGEIKPLKFNGYVSSVTTGQASQDIVRD